MEAFRIIVWEHPSSSGVGPNPTRRGKRNHAGTISARWKVYKIEHKRGKVPGNRLGHAGHLAHLTCSFFSKLMEKSKSSGE